jgi:hypothetical protein
MEWMNRAARSAQPTNQTSSTQPGGTTPGHASSPAPVNKKTAKKEPFSIKHVPFAILLVSVTIVISALVALTMLAKNDSESKYVDKSKLQAVFLNGGQVYFGRINSLNNQFIRVSDIYYLRVNQQVQPKEGEQAQQDISLVKLGCELHGPENEMLINREQVVFWENLKTDGQVTKAVAEYVKANPNGQNCETNQQTSTPAANQNNSQNQNNTGNQGAGQTEQTQNP